MTLSAQLTEQTKERYSDTIECYALVGMGFVGVFKTRETLAKVSNEWMRVLDGKTRRIENEFDENDEFIGYKLTVLYN